MAVAREPMTDEQRKIPKWGLATGHDQIGRTFGDVGRTIQEIVHHYSHFDWISVRTANSMHR